MKLDKARIQILADRFFVRGTLTRFEYGGAPYIVFNEMHADSQRLRGEIEVPAWLKNDVKLIEQAAGIGFFDYGPRGWMLGDVEPLVALQDASQRQAVIDRILGEYPTRVLKKAETFYRLRRNPKEPAKEEEYDSPPDQFLGQYRLDAPNHPVLYGSQDLEVCVHECRVTIEDDLYIATLEPAKELELLDLSEVLKEDQTEFESLDMAIYMLFLAGNHSYPISRAISEAAQEAGFDGVIYPSYFSLVRLGARPFETAYGISLRRINAAYTKSQVIENLGIFGRLISGGQVSVKCINRLVINQIGYDLQFGPAPTQLSKQRLARVRGYPSEAFSLTPS